MLSAGEIKQRARALGFDLCGVAAAERYPELDFFEEWLARGFAAGMEWLPRSAAKRADGRRVVPGARSGVVTGTLNNSAGGTRSSIRQ